VPLLVLDAWEYAYELQYYNEKAKYFEAVWHLWSWKDVAERYEAAQCLEFCVKHAVEQAA
jgi:Fe-Mn family superoxide dismutase